MKLYVTTLLFFILSITAQAEQQWRCYGWKASLQGKQFIFSSVSKSNEISRWKFDHDLQILLIEPVCFKSGLKSYLVAKLSSGAHSQKVVILDPLQTHDALVLEKTSVDDIDFEIKNGSVLIKYIKEKSADDPDYESVEMVWSP